MDDRGHNSGAAAGNTAVERRRAVLAVLDRAIGYPLAGEVLGVDKTPPVED